MAHDDLLDVAGIDVHTPEMSMSFTRSTRYRKPSSSTYPGRRVQPPVHR